MSKLTERNQVGNEKASIQADTHEAGGHTPEPEESPVKRTRAKKGEGKPAAVRQYHVFQLVELPSGFIVSSTAGDLGSGAVSGALSGPFHEDYRRLTGPEGVPAISDGQAIIDVVGRDTEGAFFAVADRSFNLRKRGKKSDTDWV